MPRLHLTVTILLLAHALQAQQPVLEWVKVFRENNPDNYSTLNSGRSVGRDADGNVYTAGTFSYTVDFDPADAEFFMSGSTVHNYGIYISKLDKDGNFAWAKEIPTRINHEDIELEVDQSGNVYVGSCFRETIDVDPGPAELIRPVYGLKDAFVIKLDSDGNLIWFKQFGGLGAEAEVNILALDKDNNIIVCGLFNNTVDFDPGPSFFNITSSFFHQTFITKLSPNGNLIWAKQFGNGIQTVHRSIVADVTCDGDGNIFTMGGFAGDCDFDPGAGVFFLSSASIADGFVSKLDANGNFVWAKHIRNAGAQHSYHMIPRGIALDKDGNVFTSGSFNGVQDFDPGTGIYTVNSETDYCFYILKLNPQGDFIWVKIINGVDSDIGLDMVIGNDNNIYAVGEFSSIVDFDPGPGEFLLGTPDYVTSSALVKLTADGDFIYAARFPGDNYGRSEFKRMAIDAALNIYVTGYFEGNVDFDPGPTYTYPLNSGARQSPFVLKLGPCAGATYVTLTVSACNSYTFNNETFDSSGTYIRTIPNATGCDSVITLELTLNKKATQQSITICEGEFFFAGGADQRTSGTYIDTLQTVLGCDSVVTTFLTVNQKPQPNLGPDRSICTGTTLTIYPGAFNTYEWQDMSTAESLVITAPGTYFVKVTDAYQCSASDTMVVPSLLPLPANFLKEKDSLCQYGSLDIAPSQSFSQYEWSTGAAQRVVDLKQPGTYWLTVTDANGCRGTDTISILPKQCLAGFFYPTAFSPNGDGKNDVFKPMLHGNVMKYSLSVYNRWGAVVFQSADPNKGWDGTISGKPQSTEIFVWICQYQFEGEEPKTEKGTVTLVR